MASKKNTNGNAPTGDESITLTGPEIEYLMTYFKFCAAASKPKPVNWQDVGEVHGLKDNKNVKQRFDRICAKFGWFKAAEDPAAAADGPSTPGGGSAAGTPAKKKNNAGGAGGAGRANGKKKGGAAAAAAAKAAQHHIDDADDDDAEGGDTHTGPSPLKKRKVDED